MKTTMINATSPIKYRMVTDTPIFGRSKVLTKKEWERQYGYNIGLHRMKNVKFEPVIEDEPKDTLRYTIVNNKSVLAKLICDNVAPMLISEVEPIYKGDYIAFKEDGVWKMQKCTRLRGLDKKEIKIGTKWFPIENFYKVVATNLHLKDDVLGMIYSNYLRNGDIVSVKTDTILQFEDIDNSYINIIHTDEKGYVDVTI